jgi:hypothetical protein
MILVSQSFFYAMLGTSLPASFRSEKVWVHFFQVHFLNLCSQLKGSSPGLYRCQNTIILKFWINLLHQSGSIFYIKGLDYIVNCKFPFAHPLDQRINIRTVVNCSPSCFSHLPDNFIHNVTTFLAISCVTFDSTNFAFHLS